MALRITTLRLHRWISLAAMAFWLLQALTGVLITFHWEIDDAFLPGRQATIDFAAIEHRIDALAPQGSGHTIGSVWTSGGSQGRFDLYLDSPEGSSVVRINGAGEVLRSRSDGEMVANGGWIDTLVGLHHNLLAGSAGSWIVGLSGLLLLSNLVLGLTLAWPRRGQWRRTIIPRAGAARGAVRHYVWHRALGLWAIVPAMLTVAAGIMLVFADTTEAIIQPAPVAAPAEPAGDDEDIGLAAAVSAALGRFPRASVSGVTLPTSDAPHYRIRLLQPGESRQIYGTTTLFVRAADGRITAAFDAHRDGLRRSFVDGLFPFHTGEMGGTVGRVATLAIGLWLVTMIILGFLLWQRKRKR